MSTGRLVGGLLARAALGLCLGVAVVVLIPAVWLHLVGPLIAVVAGAASPYLADLSVAISDQSLVVTGWITLDLVLTDGTSLPPVSGTWSKLSFQVLHVLVLALTLWSAPRAPWLIRLRGLLIVLPLAALAAAWVFTVELQVTALEVIGSGWLETLPIAPSEANREAFTALERSWQSARWLKSFHDGGGGLFLGVVSGLAWLVWQSRVPKAG